MEWNPEIPHFLSQCFLNKLSPPVLPSYASRGFRETHYMVLQFSVTLSGCWFRRRWPGRAISFRQFQKKKKKNHIKSRWSLVQHSETNPQNVNRYTWSWKLANQISYCDAGCWIKSKFRARPTKSLLKLVSMIFHKRGLLYCLSLCRTLLSKANDLIWLMGSWKLFNSLGKKKKN